MASLVWGKAQQLCFYDDREYYQVLGSLCRPGAYTITFETNSETESWGDAFRIKCLMPDSKTPDAFLYSMKTARRVNCNDYVQHLYEYHDFDFDVANKVLIGDYSKVKRTVSPDHYKDFDDGYHFNFVRYEKPKKLPKQHTSQTVSKEHKVRQVKSQPQIIQPSTKPEPPKPRPVPIPISVGETVTHKAFGKGIVSSVDGNYIVVQFPKDGEKRFGNPDIFDRGFLKKE